VAIVADNEAAGAGIGCVLATAAVTNSAATKGMTCVVIRSSFELRLLGR
jgi:hypothetical protein